MGIIGSAYHANVISNSFFYIQLSQNSESHSILVIIIDNAVMGKMFSLNLLIYFQSAPQVLGV